MPVIYEPATPEEVATVMLAFYAKGPIPTGFAVNLNWDPPVRKIAGFSGDPPAPVYSPEAVFLNTRMDGLESGLDAKADATALALVMYPARREGDSHEAGTMGAPPK